MPKGTSKGHKRELDPVFSPPLKEGKGRCIAANEVSLNHWQVNEPVPDEEHMDCVQMAITTFDFNKKHTRICTGHKRVKTFPVVDQNIMQRELDFRLPGYLTRDYWKRHKFTVEDIRWMLDCSAAIYVWHVAMLENISISNAAVKDCSAAADTIGYGGKAIAIQKLRKLYCESFPQDQDQQSSTSVLYFPSAQGSVSSIDLEKTYIPVPFHSVSSNQYSALKHQYEKAWSLGVEQKRVWFDRTALSFLHVWKWDGIYIVPIRLVKTTPSCIYMARIVPYKWYNEWFNATPCLSDMHDIVYVGNEIWCIMQEVFYVYALHP